MLFKKNFFIAGFALLCSYPCLAQYGMGGFGSSHMNSIDQRRRFLESYRKKKDNGDNVDAFYRREGIFHFAPMTATYKLDYSYPGEPFSQTTGFTNYEGQLETKINGMGYGVGAGYYFPLNKIDDKTMIAMMTGYDLIYITFKTKELRLNGGQKYSPDLALLQMNIPLGLEYKSGTDAALRKDVKSGFSFGGGAVFNANVGMNGGFGTNIRPYGMAEMAFYTGFCWKVRATGYFGKATLLNSPDDLGMGGKADAYMTIQSKGNVMLSLILMDLSWDWDD